MSCDSKLQKFSREIIDVIVIGGGNAALCAAISARRAGAKVLIMESSPQYFRGGNSRHTRNLRYMHNSANDYLTGPYKEDEFFEDLLQVTEGHTNEALARYTIQMSENIGSWMEKNGCRFQPSMRGTLQLSRTNAFFLGGGKALMNAYYHTADKLGVNILYAAEAKAINFTDGKFSSVEFNYNGKIYENKGKSLVVAAGGFQANIKWLKEYWGPAADNFIIRGTPYDKGKMLKILFEKGIQAVGDPTQCHCVAIDARAPKYDGGIVTRLDCVSFGIVVNKFAKRFYDEGENFWPKRYAIWGRLVASQPDQVAFSIIDSKSISLFIPSVFPPIEASSIEKLAEKLEINPDGLKATVDNFNAAIVPGGTFDETNLDDCVTKGIEPPKSHWARAIDKPPYYAYPLKPGITFTYLGVKVNKKARVLMENGRPVENVFAAGEIMAGNILGKGYMAGFGLTIGTVFGRIAGKEAANYALSKPYR